MGKGQIISGGADGLYQVQVLYNRDRYDAMIAALNAKKTDLIENRAPIQTEYDDKSAEVDAAIVELNLLIAELAALYTDLEALQSELSALRGQLAVLEQELQDLLDQEPPATPEAIAAKRAEIAAKKVEISDKQTEISDKQKEIEEKQAEVEEKQKEANSLSFELAILGQKLAEIDLQITSIDKRVQYLGENMPADDTVSVWCADLTEDLTGNVGTVEIPGERLSPYGILQIQPGYEDNADYDQDRDGQLFPTIATTAAQAFYNAAMLPGWQKWEPLFRHGTITAIVDGLAGVTLDASVLSSQQDLNINQAATLSGVPFEYMSCDGAAFEVGDVVLIMFTGQDFTAPKIIGFKEEPKPCEIVIPYLFASENSFDSGGILICNGGGIALNKFDAAEFTSDTLKFTGPYDLFSPYGPVSYVPDWWYQPRYYTPPGGSQITLEWQVKEFTDDDGVFWDEYPWMSGGGYDWDPTFYESYDDLFETEKPYNFEKTTTLVRGGTVKPDYCTWDISQTLELEGVPIKIVTSRQWYTGAAEVWYNQGSTLDYKGCLDQTDPAKYGVIYSTKDFYQTGTTLQSTFCIINGDLIYSNLQIWFEGLGFSQQFIITGDSYTTPVIRLYNINGQYVCLFSFSTGGTDIVGVAVEGGGLTITDVSAGIYFDGDYRDMFTGSRSNTLGLILKR